MGWTGTLITDMSDVIIIFMKNLVSLLVILVIIAAAVCGSYKSVAIADSQSEGAIPQSGDLCGGTGGNGQIVSMGNKAFTIKRKDDDSNQIIHLANQAKIETSTGSVSLSNLKKGERVTLVGGPNPDGSFTADTVVVCSGTQENRTGKATPLTIRKENTNYKNVSGVINVLTVVLFGLIWLGIVAFLRLNKKKSLTYLLFFTIFYVYLYKVLDYTLWLLNILLMMPFGFGLAFVTNFRMKKVVVAGLLLSITIEFLQLITGFMANMTFRVADVNDVIFNTLGVSIGYALFVGFVRNYRQIFRNSKISVNPILQYIADRPQIDK